MPVTFTFTLDDPTASQDPQNSIKCYESVDGATGWVEVADELVSNMTTVGTTTTWVVATADPTYYHILSPVTASAVEYPLAVQKIIPPLPANATVFTAYVNIIEVDGDKHQRVRLAAKPIEDTTKTVVGSSIVEGASETVTDANGFASLTVVADIGKVLFIIGSTSAEVDTTALGGTAVDLSGFIPNP